MDTSTATDRYAHQGELEQELAEKIEIGLKHLTPQSYSMFASDMFDLISIAMHSTHITPEGRLETINSRMGQYLNNYVPSDVVFPKHVMKELELIRNFGTPDADAEAEISEN